MNVTAANSGRRFLQEAASAAPAAAPEYTDNEIYLDIAHRIIGFSLELSCAADYSV